MLAGRFRSYLFVSCLVSVFAPIASGQEPSWPIAGPPFAASPAEIRAAADKVKAEPFMEATVLFERDAYSLDVAGRMTYRHTLIYRVETQAAIENWSEIRVQWSPWYQNQPEIHARVIASDGNASTLDPKTVTDGPARENSEDTYTDARVHKAPLPAVNVGAIVELETVSSDKSPFFIAGGSYSDGFARTVPIVRAELQIDAPVASKLRYKLHNLPNAHIKDEVRGDIHHFSLEHGYLPALADSDIDLSTHNVTVPLIEFSTGESWTAVASAYRQLAEANINADKVKNLLPQLTTDRAANIARIVAKLHKEVRYTGIEFGQASLQPAPAAEVLKRHYGDCKDKAALLVAMLRAAGIPSSLALLDAGPGADVDPELPGMNSFDHAIVYVPAAQGADPLWIDATAEFSQVGTLPSMDAGRMALIISEGTSSLTAIPNSKSEDDHLTELREVTLANYGAARIVETSLTHGGVDSSYRSTYGGDLTREKKEDLEKYAKNEYSAKTLVSINHGEAHDLTKDFALKLDMSEAKRGDTGTDDALVNIPFSEIFNRLPEWFRTDPKVEGEKLTPQQEENRKRAIAARTTDYDVVPVLTEWRYTISPPEGFILRALPENKTTKMGPATLTQNYTADTAGKLNADLRFELPKSRITTDEALALRDAVLAAYKQDMISVWFDQSGAKLAGAGKIREALAADRDLIAKHPTEGLRHVQLAYVYLKAGLGDKARKEAEQATHLDPKLSVAYVALGYVCQFNEIGVQFSLGFDLDCATKALKKAVELDPDNTDTILNLAYLDEYDSGGERYSQKAHLDDAIANYRAVKAKDKSVGQKYDDHILYDLLYARRYKELLEELEKLPTSETRRSLVIAATVALQSGGTQGVTAGIERADHLSGGSAERNTALRNAGSFLIHLQLYPEASGILSAAVEGQQNSAATAQQIAVFGKLTPWKGEYLPATDPRAVVQRMLLASITDTFTETTANEILTRHAYESEDEWQRNLEKSRQSRGMLHLSAGSSGLAAATLLDLIAGNLKLGAQGDDESGHRITMESLGSKASQYFVTKENGGYRIVTDGKTPSESGNEVLYLLKAGREKEARSLLDWTRDQMHKGGGDDPLSGPFLPRFWTVGDTPDSSAMQLAAASLVAQKPAIKDLIPVVHSAWEKATADDARTNLALLLAVAYGTVEDGVHLKEIADEIIKKYPDSYTAMRLVDNADLLLNNADNSKQIVDSHLAKHPEDEDLLRMKAQFAESRGDWTAGRADRQILFDKGKANADDYNMYGWTGLFDNKIDDDIIKAARQANMITKNSSFAELHTLACLYAQQGKTAEARDLLLKAMASANLSVPNSEVWFGFASIYQQYGINDAAIQAYKQVDKPVGRIIPSSSYVLAQARLKALESPPH